MRDGADSVYRTEEEIGQGAPSQTVSLMRSLAFVKARKLERSDPR
jgi:hypothetical protein